MNFSSTIETAKKLITFDSVSSRSNLEISDWVQNRLEKIGFDVERLTYLDIAEQTKVSLVAKRQEANRGSNRGGVCYLAHTDVVPADDWNLGFCGAFQPAVHGDRLYGRGACDMKGSLACALVAAERFAIADQRAPLYFVVTSDEEIGMIGAKYVDRHSRLFEEIVASESVGIVGEPTNLQVIHAHKGGLALRITSQGRSAHSSTRDGLNANHPMIPLLPMLLELHHQCERDPALQNGDFDPPTLSWNIVIRNEPFASNITPSLSEVIVYLRPMPNVDHEPLVTRVEEMAKQLGLECKRSEGAKPFHVERSAPHIKTMLELTGQSAPSTVCYATDGGVLQRIKQLVVCGPGSIEQAHRCDEWISLDQLARGTELFYKAFQHWTS
ncbi:MAG: M20 family metallopeptidase [Pirellulaceae bacterium]|nr:M20 family metallopeptidase [Pirellulaceae bacterium]